MTTTAVTIPSILTTTTRRTPTQPWRQPQPKQKGNKNGNRNYSDENSNNITICTNQVVRIKQNATSDSLQRSVPMVPLSSEYFSNSSLSVKGLVGQFCQSINVIETSSRKLWCPSSEKCSKRCCCIHVHTLDNYDHCFYDCSICT